MSDEPRKDVVCHDKYSSFVHTPHLDPLRREAITFDARLADHGDQFGEHGMAGKMGNLYEASVLRWRPRRAVRSARRSGGAGQPLRPAQVPRLAAGAEGRDRSLPDPLPAPAAAGPQPLLRLIRAPASTFIKTAIWCSLIAEMVGVSILIVPSQRDTVPRPERRRCYRAAARSRRHAYCREEQCLRKR